MAGADTSIIFVMTKVLSQQTHACHDKTRLLLQQNYVCHDKTFVATIFFHDKHISFVTTSILLSLWQYRQANWWADPISIYSTCTSLDFGMGVSKKERENKHTHIKTHLLICQLPTHTPKPPRPPHPQLSPTHLPAIVLHHILFSPLGLGLPVRPQGQLVPKQLQLLADCSWQTAK